MKSILVVVYIWFLTLSFVWSQTTHKWYWTIHQYPNKVVSIENRDIWFVLIKPRKTKLVFLLSWMTAESLRRNQDATMVVNAWYFGYADENTKRPFVPAWAYPWSSDISSLDDIPCSRDKNLCGRINSKTLRIQSSSHRVESNVLNAWPLLINEWIVNSEIITKHSHWLTPNYRTVLINSNRYWTFFLISTTKRTLPEVTALVQSWFPKATAINLDWWSSTSWASPDGWFNKNKILPTYFVIN